jgi:hypothetical protein
MSRRAAVGILTLGVAFVARAAGPELPAFGALHFGDSFATARAVVPGVTWRDGIVSKITGTVLSIEASAAVEFAGHVYDVSVQPQYYGGYVLNLRRTVGGVTADGCEQQLSELITSTESQLGPFAGDAQLLMNERITEPGSGLLGGYTIWAPRDHPESVVRVGEKSTLVSGDVVGDQSVKRSTGGAEPDVRLLRARGEIAGGDAPPIVVAANGDFWRQHATPCTVSLELRRAAKIPAPEVMAFDARLLRHAGSVARRHRILIALPPLPSEGLRFSFQCEVQRDRARAQNCRSTGPSEPAQFFETAQRWANAAEFDFSHAQIDRNDPRLLSMTIPVEIKPSDVRQIDFLGAPAIDSSALPFARNPARGVSDFYPPKAVRNGLEGTVTLSCQVQSDYSVLCGPRAGVAQPDDDLVAAAVKLGELYEASPTFPDGKPTGGQVFIRTVKFSLAKS